MREQLRRVGIARAFDHRRGRGHDEDALGRIDHLLVGHLLPFGEAARIGALRADHPLALLHRAEHLLVALHDHGLVGAQGLVEVPAERARQHPHHDQLDRGEGGIRHHHQALVFRMLEVGPGLGDILHLVAADRDADDRKPLRDPAAVAIVGVVHHLVEPFRLERLEQALLGQAVGGAAIGHGHHVGAGPAGADLLLQPPQHRLAAGAQELDLDPGLLLKLVGQMLGQRDRRRGVPAQIAFLARGRGVGFVRRLRRRRQPGAKADALQQGESHGKSCPRPHRCSSSRRRGICAQRRCPHGPPAGAKRQSAAPLRRAMSGMRFEIVQAYRPTLRPDESSARNRDSIGSDFILN